MPKKQETLKQILQARDTTNSLIHPQLKDEVFRNSPWVSEIDSIYRGLGGKLNQFRYRLGSWDCQFENIVVELDEQLHFNRYRLITLHSKIYSNPGLFYFPHDSYVHFCTKYESNCKKAGSYGGKWTNSSCEKQFGKASPCGNLDAAGAPRWKQRAFYDYLKDLSSLITNIPVVRIAIWDTVPDGKGGSITINEILSGKYPGNSAINEEIVQLIRRRAGQG